MSDGLASGRRFRCCTVIDRCPRASLTITVAHSLPSVAVIAALDAIIARRGKPIRLSLDNGSEFRIRAFDAWAADRHIELPSFNQGNPARTATSKDSTAD